MSKVLKIRKIFLQSSEIIISDPVSSTGYKDYKVDTEFNCKSEYQEVIHNDETSYIIILPYARLHATNITTQTGLSPVMIQNMNFEELYKEQKNMVS